MQCGVSSSRLLSWFLHEASFYCDLQRNPDESTVRQAADHMLHACKLSHNVTKSVHLFFCNSVIFLFPDKLRKGGGRWDFRFFGFGHFLGRFFGFCTHFLRFFGLRFYSVLAFGFRFSAEIQAGFRIWYPRWFSVFLIWLTDLTLSLRELRLDRVHMPLLPRRN